MVFDGLAGPQLAPKNLASVLTWVHYRGLVVLALLLAGNLFCLACPFMLVRNLMRRFVRPQRPWPRWLRHKWFAVALFALLLFAYELFDLWATPFWTAWLILAYFAGVLLVDALFRGATFCKYLCPLGHFNFTASLVSLLSVSVRNPQACTSCQTKDCIKLNPITSLRTSRQPPTCQTLLYQPQKTGNMDCTFCLDCLHACPHDNVGLLSRLPASELWDDARRSAIGRFSRRPDLAALVALFCFGALLNAFAMVTPVYALEEWLAGLLGTTSEFPVLLLIFLVGLVILPILLLALTGWLSRRLARPSGAGSLSIWVIPFTYSLVPIAFGIWLAHYSFHFLTGFWTFVPVVQSFVGDIIGSPLLGAPRWALGPLLPDAWLLPLEIGFLGLGWLGSLLVAYRLAEEQNARRLWGTFLPWAGLITLLLAAAIWLMVQPMEMRGTFLAG
jgi:hypothetical protein